MDKFFYRLIVQTLWKGLLTVLITFLGMGVIYTLFISILQPVSAVFDYWLQFGLTVAIAAVCCFFMLFVGDDFGAGGNDEAVYLSDIAFLPITDYRTFPDIMKRFL